MRNIVCECEVRNTTWAVALHDAASKPESVPKKR